jgi:hypothetical protein
LFFLSISKGIDKRLIVAAKVIANTLSGSAAKETESELLQLLRLHSKETLDAKQGKLVNSHDLASVKNLLLFLYLLFYFK